MFHEFLRNKQLLRTEISYIPLGLREPFPIPMDPAVPSEKVQVWLGYDTDGAQYLFRKYLDIFGYIWIHTKCPPVVVYTPHEYYS